MKTKQITLVFPSKGEPPVVINVITPISLEEVKKAFEKAKIDFTDYEKAVKSLILALSKVQTIPEIDLSEISKACKDASISVDNLSFELNKLDDYNQLEKVKESHIPPKQRNNFKYRR